MEKDREKDPENDPKQESHWKTSVISVCLTVLLTAAILGIALGLLPTKESSDRFTSSFRAYGNGAVQGNSHTCSKIGTEVLTKKGSVVDAIIAAEFCAGLIHMHGTGIGGGLFMTIYDRPRDADTKDMVTIFAREVAPLAANETMFVNNKNRKASLIGGLAIGVPGEVAGLHEAWRRYGKLPWATLVDPAIRLLEEGVPIEAYTAKTLKRMRRDIWFRPGLRPLLYKNRRLLKEGDKYKNSRLLNTLKIIRFDPMSFYRGALAKDIVDDIRDAGGIITEEDLAQYKTRVKLPLEAPLSRLNLTFYTPRPPSSGVVVPFILRILEEFNMDGSSIADVKSEISTYHRFIEALKFGFGKRSALGDEDYHNVTEIIAQLMSPNYIKEIKERILEESTGNISHYDPTFYSTDEHGTSSISVLGPDGSAASITSTINYILGSYVVGKRTGIIFNNEMDAFSTPNTANIYGIPASASNFIAPGKMPMSSMSPSIVLDQEGNAVHITGASDGPRIISSIAHVALRNLYLGQRLDAAVEAPRVHHQLLPDTLYYEKALSQEILDGLKELTHEDLKVRDIIGEVSAIHNTCPQCGDGCDRSTCIHAASDGRIKGPADGF